MAAHGWVASQTPPNELHFRRGARRRGKASPKRSPTRLQLCCQATAPRSRPPWGNATEQARVLPRAPSARDTPWERVLISLAANEAVHKAPSPSNPCAPAAATLPVGHGHPSSGGGRGELTPWVAAPSEREERAHPGSISSPVPRWGWAPMAAPHGRAGSHPWVSPGRPQQHRANAGRVLYPQDSGAVWPWAWKGFPVSQEQDSRGHPGCTRRGTRTPWCLGAHREVAWDGVTSTVTHLENQRLPRDSGALKP